MLDGVVVCLGGSGGRPRAVGGDIGRGWELGAALEATLRQNVTTPETWQPTAIGVTRKWDVRVAEDCSRERERKKRKRESESKSVKEAEMDVGVWRVSQLLFST